MNKTPRFALQFADGTFAKNATGRRTHKTAELADKTRSSFIKNAVWNAAEAKRMIEKGQKPWLAPEYWDHVGQKYAAAVVVPV
jgi:hypothetical protein